ncbi:MAG TPA: type 4a pilus biogenesis protein PilO [Acidimicrobiales bacterium]|nr:type 4a pilus biogenesis protein PilO [Acidimicrobiales bacterium]
MEQLTRYRIPILTGVGAFVLAIIVFVAWISPEGSKLSALHAQQTQLESQQLHLQTELTTLKAAKAHLVSNCQALSKDLGEIPGTPSVDSFFSQVTALAVASGDPNTPSISVTQAAAAAAKGGTDPVAVTFTLEGTFGQMSAFLKGLDTFPRLFTVTAISINGGAVATGGAVINPATTGYSLNLTGNIYYSSGQQNVCTAAPTAATP